MALSLPNDRTALRRPPVAVPGAAGTGTRRTAGAPMRRDPPPGAIAARTRATARSAPPAPGPAARRTGAAPCRRHPAPAGTADGAVLRHGAFGPARQGDGPRPDRATAVPQARRRLHPAARAAARPDIPDAPGPGLLRRRGRVNRTLPRRAQAPTGLRQESHGHPTRVGPPSEAAP